MRRSTSAEQVSCSEVGKASSAIGDDVVHSRVYAGGSVEVIAGTISEACRGILVVGKRWAMTSRTTVNLISCLVFDRRCLTVVLETNAQVSGHRIRTRRLSFFVVHQPIIVV